MTFEEQHINEDFYAGNYKEITVTIYEDEEKTSPKDLAGGIISYTILTNEKEPEVVLTKSSARGNDEIEILAPSTDGKCVIKLIAADTVHLYGTYIHQMNMRDSNGHDETVLTGRIRIFKSFARLPSEDTQKAYLEGGT